MKGGQGKNTSVVEVPRKEEALKTEAAGKGAEVLQGLLVTL
jgi:hypothetical protein